MATRLSGLSRPQSCAWLNSRQRRLAGRPAAAALAALPPRRRERQQASHCGPPDNPEAESWPLSLPRPKKSNQLEPSFWLGCEGAIEAQLKALHNNNFPHNDAGIEVLYRFAGFDPFSRTDYFGVSLDLGQFERFRRIMYTPYFTTLLNLSDWDITSTLEVSETQWVARVHVVNAYRKEARDYSFFMEQRFGGKYDGVWYCSKLLAEGCTAKTLYGVI